MGVEVALPTPREEEKKPGVFAVGDTVQVKDGVSGGSSLHHKGIITSTGRPGGTTYYRIDGAEFGWDADDLEHIPTVEKKSWHGFTEGERVKHKQGFTGKVVNGMMSNSSVDITVLRDDTGEKSYCWHESLTRLSDEKPKEWHGFKEGEHVRGGMDGGDENRRNGIVCGEKYGDCIVIRVDKGQLNSSGTWCCYASNTERI